MKLFTAVLLALAFGPSLLDRVLSGRNAPAPTPTFPTPTFTDACTTLKVTIQVPPTSRVVTHNKPGKFLPIPSFYGKIFFVHSTISISTASRVTPSFADVGDVAFAPKLVHQLQTLWNGVRHWWRCDSGRFVEEIVVIFLDLFPFLVIGLALLLKRALQHRHLTSEPVVQLEPTRVPLAWIEVPSVEGLLLLYSYTTTSAESPDQWRGLWIPRRKHTYYLSDGPVNRDVVLVQPNASDSALLGNILCSLWSYHAWAPQLAEIYLFAQNNLMASEPTVQIQCRELGSIRRPHLRPAIEKLGSSPTQVVSEVVSKVADPERERVPRPVEWIKIPPSVEGALMLYAYFTNSPDSPREWTSQYFPRYPYTYYLSNRPANLDSLLLDILLRSVSIYHPWAPQLAGVLLEISGGIFEEIGIIADTGSVVEVEVATIPPHTCTPNTPDLTSAIDTPATSVSPAELSPDIELETPFTLAPPGDTGDAEASDDNWVEATSTLPPPPPQSFLACSGDYTSSPPSSLAFQEPEVPIWQVHGSGPTALPGSSFPSSSALPSSSYSSVGYQRFPTAYHPYTGSTAYYPYAGSTAYQHAPMVHHPYPYATSTAYQYTAMAYHPYPYATSGTYQQPPMVYQPNTAFVAHQQIPTAHHQYPTHQTMSQPLNAEQATTTRQEVHPLLPVLAERASQRQAPVGGSMGFREALVEEAGPEEGEKKKFRRGGRRLTARKRRFQELERRGEDEGNPEAGPSSARPN